MKKGQKVRLLADNTTGTIADSCFFTLNGQKHVRYQVVTKRGQEGCWYPAIELGSIKEYATVTIDADNGKMVMLDVEKNYDTKHLKMTLSGNPDNIKEHRELHAWLMNRLLNALNGYSKSGMQVTWKED